MDGGLPNQYHIIGDKAYPCTRFCIPLFKGALNARQQRFNTMLSRARVLVENTFAIFKRRFPMMAHLTVKPEFAIFHVGACVVLHNIFNLNHENLDLNLDNPIIDMQHLQEADLQVPNGNEGITKRNDLLQASCANIPL